MLERCIASIRNQGMETEDYEILIEDDNGKGLGEHVTLVLVKPGENICYL